MATHAHTITPSASLLGRRTMLTTTLAGVAATPALAAPVQLAPLIVETESERWLLLEHRARNAVEHPDAELLAVCEQFSALELMLYPPGLGLETIEEEHARDERNEPLNAEQSSLVEKLWDLRATTLEGFQARARSLLLWDSILTTAIENTEDYWEQVLLHALLRDLAGLPDNPPEDGLWALVQRRAVEKST